MFKLEEVQAIKNAIQEHVLFIGLNNGNNIRKIKLIWIGNSKNVIIDNKNIIRLALLTASDKVILVHNHFSNTLKPSEEDKYITNVISKLLNVFNIEYVKATLERRYDEELKKNIIIDKPKTQKSVREIPISNKLYVILKSIKKKYKDDAFFLTGKAEKIYRA